MPRFPSQIPRRRPRADRRRRPAGFTFTEVMFAVVILGIGFVMIAAILPVAIQQTKDSADETTAATIAQTFARSLSVDQQSQRKLFFPTYTASSAMGMPTRPIAEYFGDPASTAGTGADVGFHYTAIQQWNTIGGSLIYARDPRFACVPIYLRGQSAGATPVADPFATLIVIVTQSHAGDAPTKADPRLYDANDVLYNTPAGNPATLQPKGFTAVFNASSPGQPQSVTLTGSVPGDYTAIGEGSFVVIASAPTPANPAAVGNVVRLGAVVGINDSSDSITWSLTPDYDMNAMPAGARPDGNPYGVYVVGKALTNPALAFDKTTNPYAGSAPDVAVYKTIIPVH